MNGSHPPDPEDVALVPRFLSSLHDLDVLEQDSIRINCRVSGRPPPDIQWYSNGQRLVQDQRHKIIVNESGCHTLLISNCQLSDTGSLTCVARNRSGEAIAQVISNTVYVFQCCRLWPFFIGHSWLHCFYPQ